MVKKETCPNCRGNKYVSVSASDGKRRTRKCPQCAGHGYRVRIVHEH